MTKIKVGTNPLKRRPFNLSHDVNTTCDWGFMQPTCKLDCLGNTSVKFTPRTFVRLHPMVAPTFGRAVLKHYAYFVPKRDVMMSYENLLSQTIYNGGGTSYIPTTEPYVLIEQLSRNLLTSLFSEFSVYGADGSTSHLTDVTLLPVVNQGITSAFEQAYLFSQFGGQLDYHYARQNVENRISIEGADYVCSVKLSAESVYIFAFRLNKQGKNLRKILLGLGYQVCMTNTHKRVSVLPLLAYYKAYFDLFAIKQTTNWQNTLCYKFIQGVAYSNIQSVGTNPDFWRFVRALPNDCYYTLSPDYFTAHQSQLNYMMNDANVLNTVSGYDDGVTVQDTVFSDEQQSALSHWTGGIAGIKLALRYLPFVNKNNVIGQHIRAFFKSHGLGAVDDNKDMGYVGSVNVNIDISDVMSTAETEKGTLGEYTGKGVGATGNHAKTFKHNCPSAGYFIVLTTVVPRTNYVQGIDPTLFNLDQYSHFFPEFDALGMQVTDKLAFMGQNEVANGADNTDRLGNFGVIPRYSEYKQKQSICNGDISLRSQRNNYLPYTLDRWMTLTDIEVNGDFEQQTRSYASADFKSVSTPQVNGELRYLGRNEFFGNFNRIFNMYDGEKSPLDDMFIVHNMFDITYIAPMKPLSDSFDTDEYEHSIEIEKA